MIEPTEEEKKNGWDAESLTRYVEERERAQLRLVSEGRKQGPPKIQNSKYNPFRLWR